MYHELLADEPGLALPRVASHNLHAWHIYAVRVKTRNRDDVLRKMASRGIRCGVHYPVPVHLQRAFAFLNLRPGSFPVCERLSRQLLSLPIYPELTVEQIKLVASALRQSLKQA